MLMQGVGYPLYMPTPSEGLPMAHRKHGIRIGDVGTITINGAFDFLFNACQHSDEPDAFVNPPQLPDGFELLIPDIRVNELFDCCAPLPGNHVKEISNHGL
jgi:hypothetical protein